MASFERVSVLINGHNVTLELGHTTDEWEKSNNDGDLWDISFEDFLNGAVEPDDEMTYWYINGRVYETNED